MTSDKICPNCDDHKCMSCILHEPHKVCIDDCPECCNLALFDVEQYRPAPSSTAHLY